MRPVFHSTLAALTLLSGCTLFPRVRTGDHGLSSGDERIVVEDSAMAQVMGPSLDKMDHRTQLRGQLGSVLPVGAVVRVTPNYEQQRADQTAGAPLAHRNPWVLVEVVQSPHQAQVGWQGWIHAETTAPPRAESSSHPSLGDHRLTRASRLCPRADSPTMGCTTALDAGMPVRVIACTGAHAHVELWSTEGLYTNGFINATQLGDDACHG
ncbi:MAG: hypothetical protein K0V04_38220 [Deltaproteobacteria bacterium]|nr:hypothetical protein [Deltaproteobacteria bacterium]